MMPGTQSIAIVQNTQANGAFKTSPNISTTHLPTVYAFRGAPLFTGVAYW